MKNDLNVDQIKKLWILDLIIQSGSLKGAASQAKITPSAISQSLSTLEKNIGKPLVIRKKGEVIPTQEALSLLEAVRPAFEIFSRLNNANHEPVPQMSWLNFGSYESIAVDILPGLIHRLREKMPHLKLGLKISRTSNLLTMVRKGELCSAIVTQVDDLDRFYKAEVAVDRLGFYISAKHPISELGWNAVHAFGVGALSPGKDGLPRYYSRFLKNLGALKPFIFSESFEALRTASANGAIVAILPNRVARRSSDLLEIRPPTPVKEDGAHRIYVVSHQNCDREEADFLAAEVARLMRQN